MEALQVKSQLARQEVKEIPCGGEPKGCRAEVAANHGLRVGKKWKWDDFAWKNREGEEGCGKKTGVKKIR
jgi:hypothetical protein